MSGTGEDTPTEEDIHRLLDQIRRADLPQHRHESSTPDSFQLRNGEAYEATSSMSTSSDSPCGNLPGIHDTNQNSVNKQELGQTDGTDIESSENTPSNPPFNPATAWQPKLNRTQHRLVSLSCTMAMPFKNEN